METEWVPTVNLDNFVLASAMSQTEVFSETNTAMILKKSVDFDEKKWKYKGVGFFLE